MKTQCRLASQTAVVKFDVQERIAIVAHSASDDEVYTRTIAVGMYISLFDLYRILN
jgi:hypothetical protein